MRRSVTATHALIAIRERVFSLRCIIAILSAQCLAAGVSILTGNKVDRITHSVGRVTGVVLGAAEHIPAACVVAVHLFVASGACPVRQPEPGIEVLRLSQQDVHMLIADHEITHAGSLALSQPSQTLTVSAT